jgi:hypothetical protein
LYDSLIRYNMPVYPGALRETPSTELGREVGTRLAVPGDGSNSIISQKATSGQRRWPDSATAGPTSGLRVIQEQLAFVREFDAGTNHFKEPGH